MPQRLRSTVGISMGQAIEYALVERPAWGTVKADAWFSNRVGVHATPQTLEQCQRSSLSRCHRKTELR